MIHELLTIVTDFFFVFFLFQVRVTFPTAPVRYSSVKVTCLNLAKFCYHKRNELKIRTRPWRSYWMLIMRFTTLN